MENNLDRSLFNQVIELYNLVSLNRSKMLELSPFDKVESKKIDELLEVNDQLLEQARNILLAL